MIKKNNPSTILITGSTGFVCKYFVNSILKSTNFNIIATYRDKIGDYNVDQRLLFVQVDLLTPSVFEEIFKKHKPDYIVHLAAMARVKDGEHQPVKVLKANYIATVNLIILAIKYGVKTMITTSSNLAQDAVSIVGIGKYLVEQFVQKTDSGSTKLINFRMPNVIDSNGAVTLIFKKQIEQNQPITITHPEMSRMFITGEHASDYLLYLLEKGENKGVYVSYEEPVKITGLAKDMIKASGKDIDIKFIGMKPGEKLIEKSFSINEIEPTELSGLGMLRDYHYNKEQVETVIKKLNEKKEVAESYEIQSIFAGF